MSGLKGLFNDDENAHKFMNFLTGSLKRMEDKLMGEIFKVSERIDNL